jgi:hypothetical protein
MRRNALLTSLGTLAFLSGMAWAGPPRQPAQRSIAKVRPAPVRDFGELAAPWRAVEMVQGGGALKERPTPGRGVGSPDASFNKAFRDSVSPDLKNFIRLGKSSLTPYEATRLAQGLGWGGQLHLEPPETASPYGRGDRLNLLITHPDGTKERTRGIMTTNGGILAVDRGGDYRAFYREYDNGTNGRAKVRVLRVLARALDDGRLQQWVGK